MTNSLTVLGIESSCDDTAASILSITFKEKILVTSSILSSVVFNQSTIHTSYGGVVPELAARAHTEKLDYSVEVALAKAKVKIDDIDLICVTSGPGLIGAVISGVTFAKALASALRKPIVGVNHLAGHALTPQLIKNTPFPKFTAAEKHVRADPSLTQRIQEHATSFRDIPQLDKVNVYHTIIAKCKESII